MGMYTMRTPSCDDEAEARAEAKAEHLANLDPRDHDDPPDDGGGDWWYPCPTCGRMDEQEMTTASRHAPGCEHVENMVRYLAAAEAEAKEHSDHLAQMCVDDPTLEVYYGRLRKKSAHDGEATQ